MSKFKKEEKICLDETIVKKPKLKCGSSSQLLFKDFPKRFSECVMFIRDRRNTNLTKNTMMAAPDIFIKSITYFIDLKVQS